MPSKNTPQPIRLYIQQNIKNWDKKSNIFKILKKLLPFTKLVIHCSVYIDHQYISDLHNMSKSKLEIQNLTKHCNEALILSILSKDKKHGYQIALEIDQISEGLFKFNHGTLYPILHKLEKEKLIKGTWKKEGPKRQRKYYSLTTKGRKYVAEQIAQWRNFYQQFFEIVGEIEK